MHQWTREISQTKHMWTDWFWYSKSHFCHLVTFKLHISAHVSTPTCNSQHPSLWGRGVFQCLGKILKPLLDNDRGCQSVWGWRLSHTHEGGQWPLGFRSTHLLSAFVPHFNKFSLFKLYKEITACPFILVPFPLKSISSPVTTTLYPLSMSSFSLYLSILCSGTLPRWPDTSLLSFGQQPNQGEVRRMGYYYNGEDWRDLTSIQQPTTSALCSHPLK